MTRTAAFSAAAALGLSIYALAATYGPTEPSPGSRGRANALSINGLQLNGAALHAVEGAGGALAASGGRLVPASE